MTKSSPTYVIGHVNPDTDSIASAMGYAWFLNEYEKVDAVAARAGQLNPQTSWVLNILGLDPPLLLPDASPRFNSIAHRLNTTDPERPLREAWAVANRTGGVAPLVNPDGTPFGLVNSLSLFDFLSRSVGSHKRKEGLQIGELLDVACNNACDTGVPRFQENTRIKDALTRILREERSEFWVVDGEDRYVGIFRQREALNPPRLRVILVDHNESGQALGALEEADLIEILDHHRLGNPTTHAPIKFMVDVVGSTSTLVSERIEDVGLSAPPALAGLLLSGLISDTLLLTSPTTTPRDHSAADRLSRWAFVGGGPLANETIQSFGVKLLESGTGLGSRDPKELLQTDLKLYETSGVHFAISQVEVTNMAQLDERVAELSKALTALQESNGLDFAIFMVTDVVQKSSRLMFSKNVPALGVLPYPRLPNKLLDAVGVVSRKKQLLPAVLGALEG